MSLQLWLPLQGDLKNIGIRALTVDGHSSTISATGGKLADKCQKFARSTSQYLSFPAFLSANSEFTYCCWFKTSSLDQTQCLFSQRTAAAATGFSIFYMGSSNDTIRFDDGASLSSSGTISATNQWYHIAVVRTATNKYIYINGALSGSGAKNTPTKVNTNYAVIGGSQGNATAVPTDNALNGYLQDVRIYDHALSAAEIKELARGLMVHYKLDDWCGNTYNNLLDLTASFGTGKLGRSNNSRITVPEPGIVRLQPTTAAIYVKYKSSLDYADYNNQTYTVSCDAMEEPIETEGYSSGTFSMYIGYSIAANTNSHFKSASDSYRSYSRSIKGEGWQHYTATFSVPTDLTGGKSSAQVAGSKLCVQFGRAAYRWPLRIKNIKLEVGSVDTGWQPSLVDVGLTRTPTKIIDSSGYENNATVTGNVELLGFSEVGKYQSIIKVKDNASNIASSRLIQTSDNKFSFNIWYNPSEYVNSAMIFRSKLNNTLGFNFGCTGSNDSYSHQFLVFRIGTDYVGFKNFEIPLNEWHMWTGTYDGTTAKLYKDGILLGTSGSATGYTQPFSDGNTFLGSTTPVSLKAYASDIRMYSTVLDIDYIKELYETSMKIDNYGNVIPFEIVEEDTSKLLKNGQLKTTNIVEYEGMSYLKYDTNLYFEPDGSVWAHIYHHNAPATNGVFTNVTDDQFAHSIYLDEHRWFNVELCNHVDKWEIMTRRRYSSANDYVVNRWVQQYNPMTATYANVPNSGLIQKSGPTNMGPTTNSGNYAGSYGYSGYFRYTNGTQAYIAASKNATTYYGAIGPTVTWQGGTPSFNSDAAGNAIKSGSVDLYLRIDNVTWTSPTNAKTTENKLWVAPEFIER